MALPLENLINVDFIPNIWQVVVISPHLVSEHALEYNLHHTSEYLSGFKKYFIYSSERASERMHTGMVEGQSEKTTPG